MEQVCLSCLNKLSGEDKLYKSGNEVYHESCYTNKVMSKAIKYANQIKSLEPDQIVAQLYGSDKFKLNEEEKTIIKSQLVPKLNNFTDKEIKFDINNIFKNIDSNQIENIMNTQLDSIYDMIISKSEISNVISKTPITKEDLKLLVNSTTSVAFSDYNLFESAIKSNIDDDMNEILMDKILENLPDDLKTKLSNIKTQTGTFSSQEIFTNANSKANTIANDNADTESDTDSDNELNIDTDELLNQILQIKKNQEENSKSNENVGNLQNFDIPDLD